MSNITPAAWAVTFGGASIPFATYSEAKRFIKTNQKDVADQRGGTFKAVIIRIKTPVSGSEAIH